MAVRARLDAVFSASGAAVRSTGAIELRGPFSGSPPAYHLRNTTAGILSGDDYAVKVEATASTQVQVRSTAASRVYAMPSNRASFTTDLTATPGSCLVWGPHATILQADSELRQATTVRLVDGAQIVVAELLVMGRLARGERFAFRRYEGVMTVLGEDDAPLYAESCSLEPGPTLAASMANRGVLVSVYVLGRTVEPGFRQLVASRDLAGMSQLPNDCGWVVRSLHTSLSDGQAFSDSLLIALGSCHRGPRLESVPPPLLATRAGTS